VTQTSATVTLGGQPLPATNTYGTDIEIYLVSKDTGQWHTFATFNYNSSLYGPTINPRLVPGAYHVHYRPYAATGSGGISRATVSPDASPPGLLNPKRDVMISAAALHDALPIPVTQTSATITLGGQPLPATNTYGTDIEIYLVSKDTGQWHTFATFNYNSSLY